MEGHTVSRRRSLVWLALVGVLAIVLLVWGVAELFDRDDPMVATARSPVVPTAEAVATTGRGLPPAPLAAFVTFVEAPVGSPANQDHEYTTDGIRRMTAALTAVLDEQRIESGDVGERLAGLHEKADRFEAAPGGTNHVARVREVFMATADVMAAVQQQHWPEAQALKNQIGDLRTTAGALENSRALTDQTPAVRSFFRRAALALQTMSAQAP